MKKTSLLFAACSMLLFTMCKKDQDLLRKRGGSAGNGNFKYAQCASASKPATMSKDIISAFGASGNGVHDDTRAFLRAAQWINSVSGPGNIIELQIPAGNYLVGAQLVPGDTIDFGTGFFKNTTSVSLLGVDILHLNKVSDVRIAGAPGANINFKQGMKYGGMTSGGTSCNFVQNANCHSCTSSDEYASVGIFLKIEQSSCVYVTDLNLEGNAHHCNLQGFYSECNGRQLPYDGVVILGGSDIQIENVNARHFGRDGIMTANSNGDPNGITIRHGQFVANCRQGFSFTSGNDVQVDNCDFDSTGVIFYNNPGCGLDIEPDAGSTCSNATFDNCNFRHNKFVGMISDNKFPDVSNITFNNCEFFASYAGTWSIWPNRMINTQFLSCTIKGQFCHVAGTSSSDLMKFQSCNVSDWDGSFSSPVSGWNGILMNMGAPGSQENVFFEFRNNSFDLHHSKLVYMEPQGLPNTQADRKFGTNVFTFHIADLKNNSSGYPAVGWPTNPSNPETTLGSFYSCELTDGNVFVDSNPLNYPPYNPPSGAPLFYQQCYWVGLMNHQTMAPTWCCQSNCNQSVVNCVCTIPKAQRMNTSDGTNHVPYGAFNGPTWGRVFWNEDQQCQNWGNVGYF